MVFYGLVYLAIIKLSVDSSRCCSNLVGSVNTRSNWSIVFDSIVELRVKKSIYAFGWLKWWCLWWRSITRNILDYQLQNQWWTVSHSSYFIPVNLWSPTTCPDHTLLARDRKASFHFTIHFYMNESWFTFEGFDFWWVCIIDLADVISCATWWRQFWSTCFSLATKMLLLMVFCHYQGSFYACCYSALMHLKLKLQAIFVE